MRKKMMMWSVVLGCCALIAGTAEAAAKKAAPVECKVESVEGTKVLLNCAEAGKDLTAGGTVTLKVKAAAAAEKPAAAPAKPAATAPAKPAEPATPAVPATPAKPAGKKKVEGC